MTKYTRYFFKDCLIGAKCSEFTFYYTTSPCFDLFFRCMTYVISSLNVLQRMNYRLIVALEIICLRRYFNGAMSALCWNAGQCYFKAIVRLAVEHPVLHVYFLSSWQLHVPFVLFMSTNFLIYAMYLPIPILVYLSNVSSFIRVAWRWYKDVLKFWQTSQRNKGSC